MNEILDRHFYNSVATVRCRCTSTRRPLHASEMQEFIRTVRTIEQLRALAAKYEVKK